MTHKVRWLKAVLIVVALAVGGGGGALVYPPPIVYGVRHHLLYVPNIMGNSITVYAATATGNVAPLRTISGASTGLSAPLGVALDVDGTLYVANAANNSITVYAPGATGNAPPIRTISGASTGVAQPTGVDLDAASNLYVANQGNNSITVYAPGATGNVPPLLTINGTSTSLAGPKGVAVAADGTLYVANASLSAPFRITVYAPGASGNVLPSRIILTSLLLPLNTLPIGVALDAADNLYVVDPIENEIIVFGPGAGCAPPGCFVTPLRIISGASTGLAGPAGVDLDRAGNLYVANTNDSITVYAPGAGCAPGVVCTVTPIRTISGASTGLSAPGFISLR